MNLIKCFSTVEGHKNAIDLVTDLNAMKSSKESEFYIHYYKNQNYSENPFYKVVANVTEDDWDELNMNEDFIKVDSI